MITDDDAIRYHSFPTPGKIEVNPTKPCQTQRDLALAYTPGVAVPCLIIEKDPSEAYRLTSKGNLVAVITDGTAVLGLGNIGALAGKPVMEGKGVLFKRFAGIDVFDIEVNAKTPDEFVAAVKAIAPTFGGINLEDIAAPHCFEIERRLKAELDIPVFHDDQHGTAIIVCAALINALELQKKKIGDIKIVIAGAGAAAMAIGRLMFSLGADPGKTLMCDSRGVLHTGRTDLTSYKMEFARETVARNLTDAMKGCDVLVGVSAANTVTQEMVKNMGPRPIVMALANPNPEISFPLAIAARSDLIMATGRSDYPNQVNNVLGFPFLFRGALDVRATSINEAMKQAAVQALALLAREPVTDMVLRAYGVDKLEFGPDYIIPKPLDSRVLLSVAAAVAKAAVASGVAREAITDWEGYQRQLAALQGPGYSVLEPLRRQVYRLKRRVAFAEGSHPKVINAAITLVRDSNCQPVLVGNRQEIEATAAAMGQSIDGIELHDPMTAGHMDTFSAAYWKVRQRKGITLESARVKMLNPFNYTVMMLEQGLVDGAISGISVQYQDALRPALQILGKTPHGVPCGVYALAFRNRLIFAADCTLNIEPTPEQLAQITFQTAKVARAFGVEPKVAMLSFSSFGSAQHPAATKMAKAVSLVRDMKPDFQVDGELQANLAFDVVLRDTKYPFCDLKGEPNVLIFPDLQSANIAYNLLSSLGGATAIGPILVGVKGAFTALRMGCDVESIVNIAVITAASVGQGGLSNGK
ncbi:MAG: NADP-dependent malic enzyme [Deltaproteobacteria bacterium CG2_30_63_29]|nr:MAG: NADP-dependent malic enzyme [Deltaproteobacteria bacterium CG2_30_63_29]